MRAHKEGYFYFIISYLTWAAEHITDTRLLNIEHLVRQANKSHYKCVWGLFTLGHPVRGWSQYPSEPICLPDELCKHHRVIVGAHIKGSLTTHWLIHDWYVIQKNKGVCCCCFTYKRIKKRAQQRKEGRKERMR